ncbi:phosphatase PAP2 family protein [Candidatus Enterococcus murrayae]|uniref:Phosphatase PAP2 family protein n=1 Tax=Candidatus Enterococcus murrayae TaxID=2815321 RepID=A0ABS3HJM7_9ENTE|nr:phosphatase PAP2 family protein [Enterococcus sp. MJM16]MBO0453667.1 phosphatase PAP2 family protein [Enterococcus sp. MJM16]
MSKKLKRLRNAIGLFLLFVIYTISLKVIDVQKVGPKQSEVGFATINKYFLNIIGTNLFWYRVTEIIGIFPLLVVSCFAIYGFWQLITRKKMSLVDQEILYLGFVYAGIAAVYIFFEHVVINYRPILVEGQLEPSYPSSHTFLAITVLLTAFCVLKDQSRIKEIVSYLCLIGLFFLVIGRLLSGVHWITDIFGGILLGLSVASCYAGMLERNIDKIKKP